MPALSVTLGSPAVRWGRGLAFRVAAKHDNAVAHLGHAARDKGGQRLLELGQVAADAQGRVGHGIQLARGRALFVENIHLAGERQQRRPDAPLRPGEGDRSGVVVRVGVELDPAFHSPPSPAFEGGHAGPPLR